MKDRPYSWIYTIVLVLIGISIALTGSVAAQSGEIVVAPDGGGDYESIQNAVDSSSDGDKIKIKPGTYNQQVEVYTKNVEIYAPNGATLANDSSITADAALRLYADVTVSGLTLTDWKYGINAGGSTSDWTADNLTITHSSQGITGYGSSGDWTVEETTIHHASEEGINMQTASGSLTIENTEIVDVGDAIDIEDSTGGLLIKSVKIKNVSDDAFDAANISSDLDFSGLSITNVRADGIYFDGTSSGSASIVDTSIQSVRNGIHAERAPIHVTVTNLTVDETIGDGIDASNATGDWDVSSSMFTNMNDKSIDAIDSRGKWQVHESILTSGGEGALDAWGAKRMINASHNYWGAADGPSETFCGSGGAIGGYNVTMYPYYTDSSLTTLSSATTGGTVQIASSCVIPEDISESNEQGLVLTLSQISADGQSDNITITMPEGVSVENVGKPRAIGTPYEVDVTNSGGPIKLEVDPDEPEATVDFVLRVPVELSSNEG
jgi:hypothetical protein